MNLPAGFKVNGSKRSEPSGIPAPPRAKRIIVALDKLPFGELLTTEMVANLIKHDVDYHLSLAEYREIVDHQALWGNRKSIASLRKKLTEPEGEPNAQD
jgi:hypothetical protein